ncbi:hypothetical protein GCM10017044_06710 [Kordiimonas sediminis]|uniref:Phosphoribosyl-ATP pyrophosphatase n=1 Tax=Kordiimonas sediminis TaxID=1735581 RepID=A0A919ALX4_9PROT|nr:phosphoribosyl-ATP diphosphatase [Kordiimonas sediminis]GHF15226.1 hypothetical protein GCM10017044_06710 [Kordiimonas sediminis]
MTTTLKNTDWLVLERLEDLLEERKNHSAETSYVARLYEQGPRKIAQKVGEEAVEAAIAATAGDTKELVGEAADLLFHLMILLQSQGLSLTDVKAELARREGMSGLIEKASRTED